MNINLKDITEDIVATRGNESVRILDLLKTLARKPDVLYETDGSTGILGINDSSIGTNWQLENYDFTPYKYLKCYIRISDFSRTSNFLTPAMVVTVPLDEASKAKQANDAGISTKTPCDMYLGGGTVTNPNDKNVFLSCIIAVDTTKTKLQVVLQISLYGTAVGDRNNNGRYLYKIEGCYD